MRLHKFIALCGEASRRKAEELIAGGRLSVNGAIVREMGAQVDPERDEVRLDGRILSPETRMVYIALYKPTGIIVSDGDPRGRRTVFDLLSGIPERLFPVGRLDLPTEGVLLLTNDGGFAQAVAHPSREIEKRYYVEASGVINDGKIRALEEGVILDGKRTAPAKIRNLSRTDKGTSFTIVLHEGRNRQVRRMVEGVGHSVRFLRRDQVGPVTLAGLQPGQWRELTTLEIKKLMKR